jgi:hypothetical protein
MKTAEFIFHFNGLETCDTDEVIIVRGEGGGGLGWGRGSEECDEK